MNHHSRLALTLFALRIRTDKVSPTGLFANVPGCVYYTARTDIGGDLQMHTDYIQYTMFTYQAHAHLYNAQK